MAKAATAPKRGARTSAPRTHNYPKTRRQISPRVSVTISQKEIDDSVERDSAHCMIADSLKRELPHMRNITVDLGSIRFTDPTKRIRYTYLCPRPAQIALICFDRGIKPDPFEVRLQTAAVLTRSSIRRAPNPPGPKTTPAAKAAAKAAARRRSNTESHRRTYAEKKTHDAAARLAKSKAEKQAQTRLILRALDTPDAPLGTAKAWAPNNGNKPVIIGGRAPVIGNLARARIFGLRQLLE